MNTANTRSPWTRWKGLLLLSVATSIGLNIWHAWITAAFGAAVLASIAPTFLFWITHNLVTDPGGVKEWREDKVGVGAAAVVTLGAFAISYVTQRDLATLLGMTPFVAKILPLIVDLTIAVASYKLVRESTQTEQSETSVRRDAPAAEATVQTPALRDAPAAAHPIEAVALRDADPLPTATQTAPVRDVKPSEPTAYIATQESTLRDADTVEIPLTSGASREAAPVRRDVESPKRRLAAVPPAVRDVGDERATSRSSDPEVSATQTDPVRDPDTEESSKQPAAVRDAGRVDDYLLRAQQLVDAGRTNADLEVVHRVLRGKAGGLSNKKLAEQLDISDSQVQRIAKADRELSEATA